MTIASHFCFIYLGGVITGGCAGSLRMVGASGLRLDLSVQRLASLFFVRLDQLKMVCSVLAMEKATRKTRSRSASSQVTS